jgi:hypothetical protein
MTLPGNFGDLPRAELEARLQQKIDQLAAVREISRAVAEAQDLQETLDLITRRLLLDLPLQSKRR